MSGAAGGVIINKEDLKATIRDYRETVLKPLNLDKSYNITGVRRRPEKNTFGDIDIVLSFPGGDKKQLKKDFAQHLEQIDKIPNIPRKKNKKYFIHGSIVTNLYPIVGKPDQYVQIDNIITPSEDEGKFTYSMLDLPAQEQGLTLGLAKAIFTELNPSQIEQLFKDLNIPQDIEKPKEGEEYDFNLNTSGLSLKIAPIGKSFGKEIWKSSKFNDTKTLLKSLGVDIENDKFRDIVKVVKNFKSRRSIDRLKGMFAKNIRVSDTEVGRDKGIKKQQALDKVASLEEKFSPLVMSLISPLILENEEKPKIAIFPGKFKPPHKDHLARIMAASKFVGPLGTVKVIISPKSTKEDPNQETITAEQSLSVFNLYKSKGIIPDNVKIEISQYPSPVVSAWKEFETNKDKPQEEQQPYIAVFGKNETKRYAGVLKIPNITINDFPEAEVGNESATNVRTALKNGDDITRFLPNGIDPKEYKQALGLNAPINENTTYSNHIDYKQQIENLTKHMLKKGMNIKPLPKVIFKHNNEENAKDFLGKTAYYDPNNKIVVLYTEGRHPKDVVRSYAHEMIHHIQNLEGRLKNISTTNTMEDDYLNDIEREAYTKGNMLFRNYTDGIDGEEVTSLNEKEKLYKHKHGFDDKLGKDPFGLNQYARELASLEEGIPNIRLIQGGANPNPPTTLYHGSGYKFDLSSLSFSRTGELKGLGGFGSSSGRCAGLYTFAKRPKFNPVKAEGIIFVQNYPSSSPRKYARGTYSRKKTERAYVYKIEVDKDIMLLNQGAPSCFDVKELDEYVYNTKIKYKEFDGIGYDIGEIILWDKKHIKSMTPILVGVPNPLKFDGRQGAAWEELDKKFKLTGRWKKLFWFDSEEKANNFVANKDKWIQYIMDKYAPIGEPKVTQNPLTENILEEGRYDTLSNQISRDIFNFWKEDFNEGEVDSTYEDDYNFPPRGIQVYAQIIYKPGFGKLKIDGGSDYAYTDKETGKKYPGFVKVTFIVDPKMLPEFWEEISMNLKDVVRHEIEHITQSGDSKTKKEDFDEDFDMTIRALVKADIIPQAEYFKLPKEVDANLQGMYFRAKKERRPFIDVINTYLDAQDITPKDKQIILNLWRSRRKALSLPKF